MENSDMMRIIVKTRSKQQDYCSDRALKSKSDKYYDLWIRRQYECAANLIIPTKSQMTEFGKEWTKYNGDRNLSIIRFKR